jgi:hypothetical protein
MRGLPIVAEFVGAAIITAAIVSSIPPPPPRVLYVPPPREGFVWQPGYWIVDNQRWVWIDGRWITMQPGYAWSPAHWEEEPNGSWRLAPGQWLRTTAAVGEPHE